MIRLNVLKTKLLLNIVIRLHKCVLMSISSLNDICFFTSKATYEHLFSKGLIL